MRADFRIANAAQRIEGPLLFLERSVNVGLNEALYVIGRDGVERLGRVATLDEEIFHGSSFKNVAILTGRR